MTRALSQPSPPTQRVVGVLNLLAKSGEALSGSEIARRLGVHKSTCHAILQALTDQGLLVRTERDKAYSLGPGLIRLGDAARGGLPILRYASPVLHELTADVGYGAWLSTREGDWIYTLEAVTDTRPIPIQPGTGRRNPFGPPFGATIAAYADAGSRERWLSRAGADPDSPEETRLRRMLRSIETNAVAIWRLDVPFRQVSARLDLALSWMREDTPGAKLDATLASYFVNMSDRTYALASLDKPGRGSVSTMAAPVLGNDGTARYEIGLALFQDDLPHEEIKKVALRLKEAAGLLAGSIGA